MVKKKSPFTGGLAGVFGNDFYVLKDQRTYAYNKRTSAQIESESVEALLLLEILNALRNLERALKK